MTYRVSVVKFGTATIEANSEAQAEAIAERKMTDGEFAWSNAVVEDVRLEVDYAG